MEILHTKILKGPNYWSNYRQKLIVFKLDLGKYEYLPSNCLEGFPDRLLKLIPSLYKHYCSRGVEGGFAQRLHEGTWLGHIIEHVALELQTLAGMDCGFGRTIAAHEETVYYVIFEYEIESAGLYAGHAAIRIIEALAENQSYDRLEDDIAKLREIYSDEGLGVSTKAIVNEAKKRGIPCTQIEEPGLILLGYGRQQKIISAALTSHTSCIGVDIAGDKDLTKKILASAFISVPEGILIRHLEELDAAIDSIGYPLVIKPLDSNHGRGVTTNITTESKAIQAFNAAKKLSSKVIVESYIEGDDFRFLIINYKLVAVAQRIPASVVGNGISTIEGLIDESNQDIRRGNKHENVLTKIKKNNATLAVLNENGYDFQTVLPKGKTAYLCHAANISAGGTAKDVTDLVCAWNVELVERIARMFSLDICGIDIIAKNIQEPIMKGNGAVIEVNAAPGLRMHLFPSEGQGRNIGKHIVDYLYPQGSVSRIPIISVTGTNGKTTTVRLISHLISAMNYRVGYTTTDGIYINNQKIYEGDCAGFYSARAVLQDPSVEFAVLECARGGIIRSGLGFDQCDISVLLNISGDHLGLNDIESIEELARVKSVVPRSTRKDGYAILNADDDLVYPIKDELVCQVALLSTTANNPRVLAHCAAGGLAAYIEHGEIIIQEGVCKIKLLPTYDIPLTFKNTAAFMIQNILAAVLAAKISGLEIEKLQQGLKSFYPSAEQLPGRMNLFDFNNAQVLVDYAHNMGAFVELRNYLKKIHYKKVGIIACPGDRREEDIKKIGACAAQMFDEIIIRHDKSGRGRTNDEISDLLQAGIAEKNPACKALIISDEVKALRSAIKHVHEKTFIVVCTEKITPTLNYLQELTAHKKNLGLTHAA